MCVESRSKLLPERPSGLSGQHFPSMDRRQTLLLTAVASVGDAGLIVDCRHGGVNRTYSSCEQRCSCGPGRRDCVMYVYTGHMDTWGPSQDILGTISGVVPDPGITCYTSVGKGLTIFPPYYAQA